MNSFNDNDDVENARTPLLRGDASTATATTNTETNPSSSSTQRGENLIDALFINGERAIDGVPLGTVVRQGLQDTFGHDVYQLPTWALICLVPIVFILLMGYSVIAVAEAVFAIQALVVGARLYDSETQDCQHMVRVWLLVFGSLTLGAWFLKSFCKTTTEKVRDDGTRIVVHHASPLSVLGDFAKGANTGWFIYGIVLVANGKPDQHDDSSPSSCNDKQWETFSFMVMFLTICYVVIGAGMIILGLALCCIGKSLKIRPTEIPTANVVAIDVIG